MTIKLSHLEDLQTLDFQPFKTGFLVKDARLARSGIQVYPARELAPAFADRDPSAHIRVWRPPEEVFSADSLASLEGLPITIEHGGGFVDAANADRLVVGHLGDSIVQTGDHVVGRVYVTHQRGLDAIAQGVRELSVAYDLGLDVVSGTTPDGEPYEAIQRNVRANHISLVRNGRCGPSCRVQDGGAECECQTPDEGVKMSDQLQTIEVNGISIKVSDQGRQAFEAQTVAHDKSRAIHDTQIADAGTKISALEAQVAKLEAEKDALTTRLADAETLAKPDALAAAAEARGIIVLDARSLAGQGLSVDGLDVPQIKRAALHEVGLDLEGKSEAYIESAFDARVDLSRESDGSASKAARQISGQAQDTNEEANPRAAYMANLASTSGNRQEAR